MKIDNGEEYERADKCHQPTEDEIAAIDEDAKKAKAEKVKKEIAYQMAQLKKLWDGSKKFKTPKNSILLEEVLSLNDTVKKLEKQLKVKREELKNAMNDVKIYKVYDLDRKMVASISNGKTQHKKVFDETRFKEDYPELYEKYQHHIPVGGIGGSLSLREIGAKQLVQLQKFDTKEKS